MNQNNNINYLNDLVTIGYDKKEGQYELFIDNFNSEACTFVDEFKTSLLQNAISHRKYDIAKFLIEKECNINNQDERGYTALDYLLSGYNNENKEIYNELIELLLEKDINLELEDYEYGNTPLMEATTNAKVPLHILEKILKKGADPHHKNKAGRSPYDMVKKYDIKELNEIFEPYV
jgi:ankyrin repeat protein